MANALTYSWTIFCETESKNIVVEQKPRPLVCPNNAEHILDESKTEYELYELPPIITDKTKNIGYFTSEGVSFTCDANTTTDHILTFPYDVTLCGAFIQVSNDNVNDQLSISLAPDSIIGVLTQQANVDDTILNISTASFEYLVKGVYLQIDAEIVIVKSVDLINSQVTITSPLTSNHNISSFVKRTIYIVKNINLVNTIQLGRNNPYPSYILANKEIKISYTNNDILTSKKFNMIVEYY